VLPHKALESHAFIDGDRRAQLDDAATLKEGQSVGIGDTLGLGQELLASLIRVFRSTVMQAEGDALVLDVHAG